MFFLVHYYKNRKSVLRGQNFMCTHLLSTSITGVACVPILPSFLGPGSDTRNAVTDLSRSRRCKG